MSEHIPAEELAAYVDGLLDAQRKSELEKHFSRCPNCLDEMVEIVSLVQNRGKIPARFLDRALGEKSKPIGILARPRLLFEIAAALLVVVFIGYFFLNDFRFWQKPERQKTSLAMKKNDRPADTAIALGAGGDTDSKLEQPDRLDAGKANPERREVVQGPVDARKQVQRKGAAADKTAEKLRAAAAQSPAPELASLPEKDFSRSKAETEALGDEQNMLAAETLTVDKTKGTAIGQQLVEEKKSAEATTLSGKPESRKRVSPAEAPALKSSAHDPVAAGASQPAPAGKKQDVPMTFKESAAGEAVAPIRIEGDVAWTDLRNPELFFAWSWFPKELVLELRIDGAGTVSAVVALGEIDPLLASKAEREAKKLLFAVSKKQSRRVRLRAN